MLSPTDLCAKKTRREASSVQRSRGIESSMAVAGSFEVSSFVIQPAVIKATSNTPSVFRMGLLRWIPFTNQRAGNRLWRLLIGRLHRHGLHPSCLHQGCREVRRESRCAGRVQMLGIVEICPIESYG